ncbi:MAG TPA: HEAT repeat domain-containing protein [Vicinamibacterales bacterium]|nr:HEAT repeat domain-containing protein [Vicinamibacterales bacterium]
MKTQILTMTMAAALAAAVPAAAQSTYTIGGAVTAQPATVDRAALEPAAIQAAAMAYADQQSERERELARVEREREEAAREKERAQREREREYSAYDAGQQALDSARWDRAISSFDRVIEMKGTRADAALYWKAYAQNKLGQRPEALNTIGTLVKEYPKSRYLNDARALEIEVKRAGGQTPNPAAESDEEIKVMALNALQNTAPEEAIPMLQKVLQGTGSPRLKSQALFVLAQSNSPKAREILVNIAKGAGNPDLQIRAIRYLSVHGGRESRAALADIYSATSDIDVKKRILMGFMQAGEKDRLVTAAQSEQNAELRATAVQQLGNMGAHDELWAMYQKETTLDVKKQIIRALFTGGSLTRLSELARNERDPELRLLAVRNLGVMGSKRTGDILVEIYNSDKDPAIRKAVINGLFQSNNAEGLVALARKESDPVMKKEMVSRLSNMRSKVATDYLIELLNK